MFSASAGEQYASQATPCRACLRRWYIKSSAFPHRHSVLSNACQTCQVESGFFWFDVCIRVLTRTSKPVASNRLIQNLVQHESFYVASRTPSTPSTSPLARDAIVDLVSSLFAMNPTNASQPSHIIPLARIYTGTLSWSDLQLRSIFERFEAHRLLSTIPLFARWSANDSGSPTSLLDALTSLDPALTMKTCTSFSSAVTHHSKAPSDTKIYDPHFLISLLSGVLANVESMNHIDWVNLFRTNVVSVGLRALAAREDDIRELAAQTLFVLGHSLTVRLLNKHCDHRKDS